MSDDLDTDIGPHNHAEMLSEANWIAINAVTARAPKKTPQSGASAKNV